MENASRLGGLFIGQGDVLIRSRRGRRNSAAQQLPATWNSGGNSGEYGDVGTSLSTATKKSTEEQELPLFHRIATGEKFLNYSQILN